MTSPLQFAEVLAALSLATDLANGQPFETTLRTTLLALELARAADASKEQLAVVYYAGVLRFLGCTASSSELADALGGDDNAAHRAFATVDAKRAGDMLTRVVNLGEGRGFVARARVLANFVTAGPRLVAGLAASCEVGERLTIRLGMSAEVTATLAQIYERWDGHGPEGREREDVSWVARVLQVARIGELQERTSGLDSALALLKRRAGGQLDPGLVKIFVREAPIFYASLAGPSVWDAVLARAPTSGGPTTGLDGVARAFADFADLKSVYTLGHSPAVAALAEKAAANMGMSEAECTSLRHAALLHDLGHVSVATGSWEKRGTLTGAEWERVRLHPYYTERVLARSPLLAPYASLAGAHHERLDGSGYPRNSQAALIPRSARILAAADVYQASLEKRGHREALAPADAARAVTDEVAAGKLDREAVDAILEVAGHRSIRCRPAWPVGLSDREVEVLRWVAQGRSNKEVGTLLTISARTVQHHVRHIYDKIGVSTRAGAALFAIEHDLLRDP